MTTAKPRSVCLRDHEARRLLKHGRVLLVRAVPKLVEPDFPAYLDAYNGGPEWCWWTADNKMCNAHGVIRCPFGGVGTRLACREKFGIDTNGSRQWVVYGDMTRGPDCSDKISHDEAVKRGTLVNGFDWRSAATMPADAVRLHAEAAAVQCKPCRDVTEEEAAQLFEIQMGDGTGPGPGYKWTGPGYWDGFSKHDQWAFKTYHVDRHGTCCCDNGKRDGLTAARCAFKHWFIKKHSPAAWESNAYVWLCDARRVK